MSPLKIYIGRITWNISMRYKLIYLIRDNFTSSLAGVKAIIPGHLSNQANNKNWWISSPATKSIPVIINKPKGW